MPKFPGDDVLIQAQGRYLHNRTDFRVLYEKTPQQQDLCWSARLKSEARSWEYHEGKSQYDFETIRRHSPDDYRDTKSRAVDCQD